MGSSHLTFQHENHLGSLWILRGWALSEGSQSEILHRHLPSGKPLPSLCHGLPQCSPEGTGWRPESESEQSGWHTASTRWRPILPGNPVYSEQPPCSSLCLNCARVHRLSVHSD